jgi:hypothetical protein
MVYTNVKITQSIFNNQHFTSYKYKSHIYLAITNYYIYIHTYIHTYTHTHTHTQTSGCRVL